MLLVNDDGSVEESYYSEDQLHREDGGPARTVTFPDGRKIEQWYEHGQLHRFGGPAEIVTAADGTCSEKGFVHGQQPRPLVFGEELSHKNESWNMEYINGFDRKERSWPHEKENSKELNIIRNKQMFSPNEYIKSRYDEIGSVALQATFDRPVCEADSKVSRDKKLLIQQECECDYEYDSVGDYEYHQS
jgi:hypothetical protein